MVLSPFWPPKLPESSGKIGRLRYFSGNLVGLPAPCAVHITSHLTWVLIIFQSLCCFLFSHCSSLVKILNIIFQPVCGLCQCETRGQKNCDGWACVCVFVRILFYLKIQIVFVRILFYLKIQIVFILCRFQAYCWLHPSAARYVTLHGQSFCAGLNAE